MAREKKKIIITVAPSSNFQGKEANPGIPYSPQEIADCVYDCYNEGASMVHIHARDENGHQTNDPAVFREINDKVRQKCNIILQNSTAPAVKANGEMNIDEGLQELDTGTEMVSLNSGLLAVRAAGTSFFTLWTREWIENALAECAKRGIKADWEVHNATQMEDIIHIYSKLDTVEDPISLCFCMNMASQGSMKFTPDNLLHCVNMIPDKSKYHWSAMAVGGANQHKATCMALAMGGGVRVGFEDNIYYRPGELAVSNAQQVKRIATVALDMGYDIATPDEARAMLGVKRTADMF